MEREQIDTDNNVVLYQDQNQNDEDNTDTNTRVRVNIQEDDDDDEDFPPPPVLVRQYAMHEMWVFDPVTETWTREFV